MQPIIKTKDLGVSYVLGAGTEVTALKAASIEIFPREYVIIFGPSGCGKSTLLYTLAGLEVPTNGTVVVDGKDLNKITQDELVEYHRNKIGMVFQAYYLINSVSVFDNVAMPQIFENVSQSERIKKTEVLLKRFGVFEQRQKLPSELSGGQQQRVAIARSLVNNPEIILADEPVGNLDSKSSEVVMQLLQDLNKKDGKTIILVTHDSRFLGYADRVIYMKDGLVEKEVVNKQVVTSVKEGEMKDKVHSEYELLARVYSGLSPAQVGSLIAPFKAKMLVSSLISDFEAEEISRMEKLIQEYLFKLLTIEQLSTLIDKPMEDGGVGLNKQTVENFVKEIESVVKVAFYLHKGYIEESKKHPHKSPQELKVNVVKGYLLRNYDFSLNNIQKERLRKVIQLRLLNEIDRKQVFEMMDRPIDKLGVGLNSQTAKKIAKDFELLLLIKYGLD